MPEQQIFFNRALEFLEDNTFNEGLSRNQHFEVIQKALQSDDTLCTQVIDRILALCIHDLQDGVKQSSVLCLHIIATILKRIQDKPSTNLLPSAKAVLHILQASATLPTVEALQTMCFNTLLDYPSDVLTSLALEIEDFWEVLNVYCSQQVSADIRFQTINFILKVLKSLSPDKIGIFVKKGLAVWFSKVVPYVMSYCQTVIIINPRLLTSLEVLEMLTEELVKLDYSNNTHWQAVLDNIYNPKKYPAIMKNLLVSGNEHWHRLWIIFIKLLEDQITIYRPGVGSPINSMLPVVETAFKLNVTNRCTAFQCWNVLIDVFSAEINEQYVEKRIKLLLIPLKLNNAKVEETALAKLNTWWHFIKQFETRMNDTILYPFLHFCFGKHIPEKISVPGLISPKMQENCVKAFVELVGHVNCEGCGVKERLKAKLISPQVLVNHWNDWVHSLKVAIKIYGRDNVELGIQPISCAWKSFVMTIAEMPENNIRKDLFNELLAMIKQLAQESRSNTKLADIIVNVLISSLFEEDSIKPLLNVKEIQNGPLRQLLSTLVLVEEYRLANKQSSSANPMKLVTEFVVNKCRHVLDETVEWLVNDVPPNDATLELWTALAESLQISRPKEDYILNTLLRWPIKHMKKFTNAKEAAQTWASTFSLLNVTKGKITEISNDVISTLARTGMDILVASPLALCALLSIIKASLVWEIDHHLKIEMLLKIVNEYNDYKQFDRAFPLLIDTLNLWVSKLPQFGDRNLYSVASIINKMLNILNKKLKESSTIDDEKILIAVNAIKPLFRTDIYGKVMNFLAVELLECRSLCQSQSVHQSLDFILNLIASHKEADIELRRKIKDAIEKPAVKQTGDVNVMENLKSVESSQSEFTTPVPKSAKKNQKKKETNIVNTVVENGEEFAVIQSNWKFNPKKLTENQKEKLQRKREDIPALYQDLSQSQDEFKLQPWKTDSQSATNSRSASTTSNEDISTALKNIPDTNIVPKIISNFFSESPKPDIADKTKNQETCSPKSNKTDKANSSPSVRTPRMALKDRVSRNVRNLIEKSTVSKDVTQKPDLLNQTVSSNIFNTPVTKCKETKTGVNSAPSKISADRPARVKRKPKKFDDTELFLLKKSRNSNNQSNSQSPAMNSDPEATNVPCEIDKDPVVESNKISETGAEKCESKTVENKNETSEPVEESKLNTDEKNLDVQMDKPLDIQVVQVSSSSEKDAVVSNINDQKPLGASISEEIPDEVISCSTSDTSAEIHEEHTQVDNNNKNNLKEDQSSPKQTPKRKDLNVVKSSTKKKSRIEKELAIDMVEGHPFLKLQSEKRVTRKCLSLDNFVLTPNSSRRKSLTEKLNKSKVETKNAAKPKKETNSKEPLKEKPTAISTDLSITVCETQDLCAVGTQDLSEDVIESSQDSTTTMSVKSFKSSTKKTTDVEKSEMTVKETQNLIDSCTQDNTFADVSMAQESKDDTEIPANKTDIDNARKDLTEEMDTQPTDDNNTSSGEVILINDEEPIIVLNSEDTLPGPDTLEFANADTEPMNPSQFVNTNVQIETSQIDTMPPNNDLTKESNIEDSQLTCTANDITMTLSDITQNETTNASSPSKDDDQRKKDFLNNTLEISPIKALSPIEPKSPSPETSSDFLIIKLSGPIQMNGEPLEISNSPEMLAEEKSSPDKRDQSPPRLQVTESKSSPSSSLSLKKNRPQVRSGGRAAQMLGLCVPERAQTIMNIDRPDTDEPKKSNPVNTPVRRNLRMLYAPVDINNIDANEDSENFLRFEKVPPPADCSPAGPILKRKLAEISDEATVSPANKRKRVSFHDPVSTSVSVQKYIETSGVRSPQSSALKRLERQIRNHPHMKSPKRLENLFKLDSILVKTVESFTENDVSNNDTQLSSLEQTPAVEIVKTSELNDADPIFPDLIDCKDSIHNIASELSSPAMKLLLVKELEGKIETVGDLAKLTELEVNRLCVKAPKVQVVKKVLGDYLCKMNKIKIKERTYESVLDKEATGVPVEVQTSILTSETETQTSLVLQRLSSTQTDSVVTMHKGAQTEESGRKSTEEIIKSCLQERKDFVPKLSEQLDKTSIRKLADCMSAKDCTDILVKNMTSSDAKTVFNHVLQRESELQCSGQNGNKELSFLLNYLCDKFDAKDLILFCSQMLQKVHDKRI